MSQEKYIGMDVHAATISAAVKNAEGKLLMECVLETKASTILEFIQGLRGTLAVTFEEGTMAAWLHDLLQPHISRQETEKLMRTERQNSFPPSRRTVGWMSRSKSQLRSRQNFFLDFPFDRTH